MRFILKASVCSFAVLFSITGAASAQQAADAPLKVTEFTFGRLKSKDSDLVQAEAMAWLKNKTGDASAVKAIWATDSSLLDKVTEVFSRGEPLAASLIQTAKNADKSAPKVAPLALVKPSPDNFFRANLGLAYAKELCQNRVYEEALEVLQTITVENVVDPASYLFFRAVAEHALMKKDDAMKSIVRLIDEAADAPDRYKMLASIMFVDMQAWKDDSKDLSNIARLMDNVERRLDLSRGGKQTQELQKKIVFRLDEKIKEMENQANGKCDKSGQCPNGGSKPGPGSGQGSQPQQDSFGGGNGGAGTVDQKKLKNLQESWGKLNEKERAKAMMDLTKDLPPKYRLVIEEYFKSLGRVSN